MHSQISQVENNDQWERCPSTLLCRWFRLPSSWTSCLTCRCRQWSVASFPFRPGRWAEQRVIFPAVFGGMFTVVATSLQSNIEYRKTRWNIVKTQKADPSSTLSLADGEWLIERCNEQAGGWHPTSQRSHWSYAHQRGDSWDTWRNVGCQCGLFTPFSGSGIHVDPGA